MFEEKKRKNEKKEENFYLKCEKKIKKKKRMVLPGERCLGCGVACRRAAILIFLSITIIGYIGLIGVSGWQSKSLTVSPSGNITVDCNAATVPFKYKNLVRPKRKEKNSKYKKNPQKKNFIRTLFFFIYFPINKIAKKKNDTTNDFVYCGFPVWNSIQRIIGTIVALVIGVIAVIIVARGNYGKILFLAINGLLLGGILGFGYLMVFDAVTVVNGKNWCSNIVPPVDCDNSYYALPVVLDFALMLFNFVNFVQMFVYVKKGLYKDEAYNRQVDDL